MKNQLAIDSMKSYRWIKAVCVATFDNELGMIVEEVIPSKALTEQEIRSVAMLSFPESNCSESEWEHTFFYRFRRDSGAHQLDYEASESQEYLFGFAYYIQRKDSSQPRGYLQKSYVIVTPFYLFRFYMRLVQLMGRVYFSSTKTGFLKVFSLLTP